MVRDMKQDGDLVVARKLVLALHEKGNFARYLDNHNSDEYKAILKVLNHYEFVASGIREGAFDEKIFKRMQYSVAVKDWDALCPFVNEFRNQNMIRTLFQEFEWMGERWKKKQLHSDAQSWWH